MKRIAIILITLIVIGCALYFLDQYWIHRYDAAIKRESARHHVDPDLVWSIAYEETYFRPWKKGRNGEIGLMQAALVGAGIILLAIFVWHEGRTPHPILPLSFFHHTGYASSISSSFLAFFSGFGLSSYLPLATNSAFRDNRAFVGLVVGAFTIGWSTFAFTSGRLVHRIGERLPSVIGIVVHILGLLLFMVAFEHGLGWVIAAALISGAGIGLLSPALTVVVQNSVPVARMGSATTSQQFIRQIGAALGVSAFVLAATVGGFRVGLLMMIAVSAGTFACVLALPAHSLHSAHHVDALE